MGGLSTLGEASPDAQPRRCGRRISPSLPWEAALRPFNSMNKKSFLLLRSPLALSTRSGRMLAFELFDERQAHPPVCLRNDSRHRHRGLRSATEAGRNSGIASRANFVQFRLALRER